MRKFILIFAICLTSIPFLLAAFLTLAIETKPRVDRQLTLTPELVARAKQIIDTQRHQAAVGRSSFLSIFSEDADIAANYLAIHFAKGNALISTADQSARVYLSLPISQSIVYGYLNIEATLIQTAGLPRLQSVRIGNLVLPDYLTDFLVSQIIHWSQNNFDIPKRLDSIEQVQISPNKINIKYHSWNNNLLAQEFDIPILSKQTQALIYRYHMRLVKNSRQSSHTIVTLPEILTPLMQLAVKRSINGDAIEENRAVILATTFYVLRISIELLIPAAIDWSSPADQLVTLEGRDDFAKHFITSAAITAHADAKLSNTIGLYKEMIDLQHGSGFSFNDIAANLAGTRFGRKAVTSNAGAHRLQQLVSAGLNDTDLMPLWSDLPERMSETEFEARFGNINSPAYQNIMQEIENRISMLRVLH